jgi:GT2 family glycosyltransferase
VVIPTLAADSTLADCLESLRAQTYRNFEVIIVDNSAKRAARQFAGGEFRVIENASNVGFGAAINQGWRASSGEYIATLNDDAQASPEWLEELVRVADRDPETGMVASQVRLDGDRLDSAGMAIAGDGSSKQQGHGSPPSEWPKEREILTPSGSAALYRRAMLDDLGGFDESFFLYCEDTDIGLRAAWRGWRCVYAPRAVVTHRYSHSAGRASKLKAWYVERNRLRTVIKNFPASLLWRVPFIEMARYFWHVVYMLSGRGTTAAYARDGGSGLLLFWFVVRAHVEAIAELPRLLSKRRQIRRRAYRSPRQFARFLRDHSISTRQVAAL